MQRWFVGKVRFNEHITASNLVRSLRRKFPKEENFDILEIHNASMHNDPSPPSKAVAVFHRSSLNGTPCTTTVFQRILDYNNRDFYIWETQRLLDTIADQWLTENGGGVQLTINRDPTMAPILEESMNGKFNRLINHMREKEFDQRRAEVFSSTKSTCGHSLWKNIYEKRIFAVPFGSRCIEPVPADSDSHFCSVPGISNIDTFQYYNGKACVRLLHVNRVSSTMYVQALHQGDYNDYVLVVKQLLRDKKCIEAVLLSENPWPGTNSYHAFSIHKRIVGKVNIDLPTKPLMLGSALCVA